MHFLSPNRSIFENEGGADTLHPLPTSGSYVHPGKPVHLIARPFHQCGIANQVLVNGRYADLFRLFALVR